MKHLFFIIFVLLPATVFCQKHDNNWIWGSAGNLIISPVGLGANWGGARIDFSNNPVAPFVDVRQTALESYNAMISDKNGRLAFFTNGLWVADRLGNKMLGGDSLNFANGQFWNYYRIGWGAVSEIRNAAIILPKPGVDSIYYLFHENYYGRTNIGPTYGDSIHLCYSIIDMSLNNGLGAVVQKNKTLLGGANFVYNPTACKHANGRDWWVVFRDLKSADVYLFLFTTNGIEQFRKVRIDQSIPTWREFRFGATVFSPDGSKYACYDVRNGIQVYNFDRCDGTFIPDKSYTGMDTTYNTGGLAFSPNNRYLYLSQYYSIVQFDMQAPIFQQDTVLKWDSINPPNNVTGFDMIQLMPDGKIYGPNPYQGYHIHVINAPDSAGLACRAVQRQIQTPTWNNGTLPHYPNYRLGPMRGSGCDTLLSGVGASLTPNPKGGIQVYPNPTSGLVHLELEDNLLLMQVLVYDALGREVSAAVDIQARQVDLSGLPNGVYFLELRNEGNEVVKRAKLIKN